MVEVVTHEIEEVLGCHKDLASVLSEALKDQSANASEQYSALEFTLQGEKMKGRNDAKLYETAEDKLIEAFNRSDRMVLRPKTMIAASKFLLKKCPSFSKFAAVCREAFPLCNYFKEE